MATTVQPTSFLATRQGKLLLVLLCAVAFLDFLDASIVNVALPTIRRDLHFTVQNLQWVLSGYLLTYGGFLLLGGRMADLLGRRRILLAGTSVFALSSLTAGLASSAGLLVGARLAQGVGAAMMSPAALSILTTSFNRGTDRLKALGAWGAMAGISSAAGVFLGGLLAGGPGWRWVFFANLPVCAIIIPAAFRLVSGEHHRAPLANFDTPGAILVTAGMLLLVYTLIRVPDVGWSGSQTIAGLSGALMLFAAFTFNELRHRNPLVPLSIFRIPGLAAADATQVIAMAGFYSMFFFITLYMQTVLRFSPLRAGAAYLPVTIGVAVSAGICSKLFEKTGTGR
jgi:EmrB/QacA subfamily drug resistance transporter